MSAARARVHAMFNLDEHAERELNTRLDDVRVEVLAEAAAFVGNDDTCRCGGCDTCYARHLANGLRAMAGEKASVPAAEAEVLPKADVVAWLTKKAREGTPIEQLASKAARGAIRPDNLRMLPATFFEPDRTYTRGYWTFQCLAVEPTTWGNRETRAVGYLTRSDGTGSVCGMDPDDWAHGGWTDTTNTTTGNTNA